MVVEEWALVANFADFSSSPWPSSCSACAFIFALSSGIRIFQLRNDIAFLPSNWGNLFTQSHERFHNIFGRIPLASNYARPKRLQSSPLRYFGISSDSSFPSIWFSGSGKLCDRLLEGKADFLNLLSRPRDFDVFNHCRIFSVRRQQPSAIML